MIKTGIIGCGKVAHLHAQALRHLNHADFRAVCSRDQHKVKSFSDKYKVKGYHHVGDMVAENEMDLAIICTPHPAHAKPAIEAMKAGAHVLIEKPMASNLADCDAILNMSAKTGRKIGVVSQRRWYPSVKRMKQAIEDGKIGQPALGTILMLGWRDRNYYDSDGWRGTWQDEGGGVLVNQAPHQLDILLWMMGEIDELYGTWANLNHEYIEVDDTALAIIRFKNGALGNIVVSNSQKPGIYGKVHVHGTCGASVGVQTDGGAMFIAGMTSITEPAITDIWSITGEEHLLNSWKEEDTKLFNRVDPTVYFIQLQIEDYFQAIIKNREPLVTGIDGRKTVELFTAIYQSDKLKAPVKFPIS